MGSRLCLVIRITEYANNQFLEPVFGRVCAVKVVLQIVEWIAAVKIGTGLDHETL